MNKDQKEPNWELLKGYRCPLCGALLIEQKLFTCTGCNFMISKGKYFNIVGGVPSLEIAANKLLGKSTKYSPKWYGKPKKKKNKK